MECLVGKVLNVVDGQTIDVEIAPLNPRLEQPVVERISLVERTPPAPGTLAGDLATIQLHRELFWKVVILRVLARDSAQHLICTIERAVG